MVDFVRSAVIIIIINGAPQHHREAAMPGGDAGQRPVLSQDQSGGIASDALMS
jgi:hypothetical protein